MHARPTIARPAQGLNLGNPRENYSPTKTSHHDVPKNYKLMDQSRFDPRFDGRNMDDSHLPSPDDEFIACELERLADERNIPEILENGFLNGSSCIRLSLSPRGVLRDSIIGDFNNLSLESYSHNPSLMDRLKRKNQRGALVITSDD